MNTSDPAGSPFFCERIAMLTEDSSHTPLPLRT